MITKANEEIRILVVDFTVMFTYNKLTFMRDHTALQPVQWPTPLSVSQNSHHHI